MIKVTYNELLDAGVHFGHLKRKWNPNMGPYIFMEKNGIHIIDLNKTAAKLKEAYESGARGGHPKLTAIYTRKELEDVLSGRTKD